MQTDFDPALLATDPHVAQSAQIIRSCVHCGFCLATCPTYVLLGNENDSPRGRIYLIKDMLERQEPPSARVVTHLDRCLSCLACTTTCPSGVDYMRLIDHARVYVEQRFRRPWHQRAMRGLLALVLPYPGRLRVSLRLAPLARPAAALLGRSAVTRPLGAMLALAPRRLPASPEVPDATAPVLGRRVILLAGCAEPVLAPSIRAATERVLARAGVGCVASPPGEGCCGALVHHLGREAAALDFARANVAAWHRMLEQAGVEAILTTASGCGSQLKQYGALLANDPRWATRAALVASKVRDISEYLAGLDLPLAGAARPPPHAPRPGAVRVAYHAACALQHGQRITAEPAALLRRAGYEVVMPTEGHLCCGSAGTYNILQPELADALGARKAQRLDVLGADVIAAGNIGCLTQIAQHAATPVVHVVELLDWAQGGPTPAVLAGLRA